jgi:tetraacyldisaccharide 4'-kinase
MVHAVARWMRDRDHRVCILSRGYGRLESGPLVVSRGDGPLIGPDQAGDEPMLLASELRGVAVVVAAERAAAGLLALETLDPRPTLFLLDDGFSHLRLARDLDILVFPASDPFAGGRLLPRGRLREPLRAASRAQAAVLTGAENGELLTGGLDLAQALAPFGFRGQAFASASRTLPPVLPDGEPLAAGTPVLALSGVARPAAFSARVRTLHFAVVAEMTLPDHHAYPETTIRRIEALLRSAGARAVLTTGKDRVKLAGRLSVPIAELPLRAEPEPAFWSWLGASVDRLTGGRA